VVLLVGGFLRLGAISDFVSVPVMTGFLFGLGLTIIVGQFPKGAQGRWGRAAWRC
jgi:MFS superfamily sulfate permease-like transporter